MPMKRLAVCLFGILLFGGCSRFQNVVKPQELSENYALTPGTVAEYHSQGVHTPAPALVDGDVKTIGETGREIIIRLPEPRPIRRIVTRASNYEDVILYVGGKDERDWKMVKQIKQNRSDTITIKVNVLTSRIRLRIGGTHDDKRGALRAESGEAGTRYTNLQVGTPKAGEIELYGFRSQASKKDDLLF